MAVGASRKWVGLKLQVGCTNQQKILIGVFNVMWAVVSVHAPGGSSGQFFAIRQKKRCRRLSAAGGTVDEWKR